MIRTLGEARSNAGAHPAEIAGCMLNKGLTKKNGLAGGLSLYVAR